MGTPPEETGLGRVWAWLCLNAGRFFVCCPGIRSEFKALKTALSHGFMDLGAIKAVAKLGGAFQGAGGGESWFVLVCFEARLGTGSGNRAMAAIEAIAKWLRAVWVLLSGPGGACFACLRMNPENLSPGQVLPPAPELIVASAHRAGVLPASAMDGSAVLPVGAHLPALARPQAARLPRLAALLRHMRVQAHHWLDEDAPLTPLELAQALAHGLPGATDALACIPWAAFESGTVGTPCAWLTPCQWLLGMDHALLADPAGLMLAPDQAHVLRQAVAPLLAEAGLVLLDDPVPRTPYLRWLAQGEPLRHLPSCTLARARQQRLTPRLLPRWPAALMRLQSEIQMLLQAHPLNAEREAAGLPPVNALWMSGAGVLDEPALPQADVRVFTALQDLPPDASGPEMGAGLQELDAACAALLHRPGARLSFCAPDVCLTLVQPPAARHWLARLMGR